MKTPEQLLEELIATIERNAVNNKAEITNVALWASSWREELRQFSVIEALPEHECKYCGVMTHQPDEECYRAPD
jgi:hypothetical protein